MRGPEGSSKQHQIQPKATRTNKSFIGVLWSAWSDGVVAHWVELIALEVEAAISSFTDLGPPQTRFTRSCVCPYAKQNKLTHAKMVNKDGKVVEPVSRTFQAAAANADWAATPG